MGTIDSIGQDVINSALSNSALGGITLYGFAQESIGDTAINIRTLWSEHQKKERTAADFQAGGRYVNALGAYKRVARKSETSFRDENIIGILFGEQREMYVNEIFKYQLDKFNIDNSAQFHEVFQRARMTVYETVANSKDVLEKKAFPATFFHKDILMMFNRKVASNSLGMFNEDYAVKRIEGTGEIILRMVNGAKTLGGIKTRVLSNCLMMAEMHNNSVISGKKNPTTNSSLFNQGSAAFTLLTFSYLIGKAMEEASTANQADGGTRFTWKGNESEKMWYFFWKILGSSMGVHTALLPDNHDKAEALWNEFLVDDKILAPETLAIMVEADNGVDNQDVKIDYTEDETLCGYSLAEVVSLVTDEPIVKMLKKSEAKNYKSASGFATKEGGRNKHLATKSILHMLRHGVRLRAAKINNPDLIYLVDLPHLLEVYKRARSRLSPLPSISMRVALVFAMMTKYKSTY